MRKNLGNKRNELHEENITSIMNLFNTFQNTDNIKIFDNEDFGYTKVTVERPQQLNFKVDEERLENLYSIPAFNKLIASKKKNPEEKEKGEKEGKQQQNKIIDALKNIPNNLIKSYNEFDKLVTEEIGSFNIITPTFKRNIIEKLSKHDDTAEYIKDSKGKLKPDPNLRDTEKIPLKTDINSYFNKEVKKYYKDAWMDRKKDKIGYEINFTRYFYKYEPPRPLEEIEADIKKVTKEIQELLSENFDDV
ncbi:MAG: hypothetical protein LBT10_03910 [Methanobrevibacter sp.]|jgi:type I restriction enzyme M protein|nr:hypothetical protein [Methanobrevibacter sp.]